MTKKENMSYCNSVCVCTAVYVYVYVYVYVRRLIHHRAKLADALMSHYNSIASCTVGLCKLCMLVVYSITCCGGYKIMGGALAIWIFLDQNFKFCYNFYGVSCRAARRVRTCR